MKDENIILLVVFYQTSLGNEPVREWLLSLSFKYKKLIGSDIKNKLWEVRTNLPDGIARVIFTILDDSMILLHGFIKKSQKLEKKDIDLAIRRRKDLT